MTSEMFDACCMQYPGGAWVGVISLHRASTDLQMNCNPTVSKCCRASIILMWLSISVGCGVKRLASCWGEHGRVTPWRSASSMVMVSLGILWCKAARVPSCMGEARAIGNPQLKPGAWLAATPAWGADTPGTVPGMLSWSIGIVTSEVAKAVASWDARIETSCSGGRSGI